MTRYLNIRKAGVIGAGTMGAGIAAHLANCGIPTMLLDIVPPQLTEEDKTKGLDSDSPAFRNRIAQNAVQAMLKDKSSPLHDRANATLIWPGNLEDDFEALADVDWIVEVVSEELNTKQALFTRLESIHTQGQIVSSNTSGFALDKITQGCTPEFMTHTMITRFANPPGHAHELELRTSEYTDAELFEAFIDFAERRLGKGVVLAKSKCPADHGCKRAIHLARLKQAGRMVRQGKMASIIDLGEGILCLEFHSRANALSTEVLDLMQIAVQEAEYRCRGLVIGNQGASFCCGGDLNEITGYAHSKDTAGIDAFVRNLESAQQALKYSQIPTVAAVHGQVLGAGCQVAMFCDRALFAPETKIGLVEQAVGLIPTGGGCKEIIFSCDQWIDGSEHVHGFGLMSRWVDMLARSKTSSNAVQARKMGFLRACDSMVMNKDALLFCAKQLALQLSEQGYQAPRKREKIRVLGRGGIAEFKVRFHMWRRGNFISEYDEFLLNKLVCVLCGGDVPDQCEVTEQYLLDLEREVFVFLTQQKKTQQRMEHMLKTGKPLFN